MYTLSKNIYWSPNKHIIWPNYVYFIYWFPLSRLYMVHICILFQWFINQSPYKQTLWSNYVYFIFIYIHRFPNKPIVHGPYMYTFSVIYQSISLYVDYMAQLCIVCLRISMDLLKNHIIWSMTSMHTLSMVSMKTLKSLVLMRVGPRPNQSSGVYIFFPPRPFFLIIFFPQSTAKIHPFFLIFTLNFFLKLLYVFQKTSIIVFFTPLSIPVW